MSKFYTIKTVGDLITELNKYDKNMPVMHYDISPSSIARVTIQDINQYTLGGKITGKHKAVVIR